MNQNIANKIEKAVRRLEEGARETSFEIETTERGEHQKLLAEIQGAFPQYNTSMTFYAHGKTNGLAIYFIGQKNTRRHKQR